MDDVEKQVAISAQEHAKALEALEADYARLVKSLSIAEQEEDGDTGAATSKPKPSDNIEQTLGQALQNSIDAFLGGAQEASEGRREGDEGELSASLVDKLATFVQLQAVRSTGHYAKRFAELDEILKKLQRSMDDLPSYFDKVQAKVEVRMNYIEGLLKEHKPEANNQDPDSQPASAGENVDSCDLSVSAQERLAVVQRTLCSTEANFMALSSDMVELRARFGDLGNFKSVCQKMEEERITIESKFKAFNDEIMKDRKARTRFGHAFQQYLFLEKDEREAHRRHFLDQVAWERKARDIQVEGMKELISFERSAREQGQDNLNSIFLLEKEKVPKREETTKSLFELENRLEEQGALLTLRLDSIERDVKANKQALAAERDERTNEVNHLSEIIRSAKLETHSEELLTSPTAVPMELDKLESLSRSMSESTVHTRRHVSGTFSLQPSLQILQDGASAATPRSPRNHGASQATLSSSRSLQFLAEPSATTPRSPRNNSASQATLSSSRSLLVLPESAMTAMSAGQMTPKHPNHHSITRQSSQFTYAQPSSPRGNSIALKRFTSTPSAPLNVMVPQIVPQVHALSSNMQATSAHTQLRRSLNNSTQTKYKKQSSTASKAMLSPRAGLGNEGPRSPRGFIESITCGQTRYDGEYHSSAKVQL